jgi:heme A synthase
LTCQLAVAIGMYLEDPARRDRVTEGARRNAKPIGTMALAAIVWLAVLMWIGGYMAESGAATACADWPTCNGLSILPAADEHEIVHMGHRYLAGAFLAFLVPFVVMSWKRRTAIAWAAPLAVVLGFLYVAQVFVGALNVWYVFPEPLTVSHTAIASGIWFTLSAAVFLSFYSPVAERALSYRGTVEVPA